MAVAAIVAGTVISASGQYQAGKANQAIARHNAELGGFRAVDARRRGDETAQQARHRFSELQSSNRVGFATQNIDLGVGAPVETEADIRVIAELEVNTIKNNAAMEAWGFEQGAAASVLSGEAAKSAGTFGAAGSLLTGLGAAGVASRTPKAPGGAAAGGGGGQSSPAGGGGGSRMSGFA